MPEWNPAVEQRAHQFGEAGVRSSLEEVCKRAAEGAAGVLKDPKQLVKTRTWSIEKLDDAKQKGRLVNSPRARAEVLLEAVQQKLWVPDPIGIEYIPKAHHLACDKHGKDGEVCVKGDDCFAEGTLVLTDQRVGETFEAIPVEDLKPGMRIWGLGRWSVVQDVWSKGELVVDAVEFDTSVVEGTGQAWLTPDHHVYVLENGAERRITVAELQPGMKVPRPIEPGVDSDGVASREVRAIHRGIYKVPCWDIQTDDHRVYLPEHDVTVSNCDGLAVLLAACFCSVGIYTMIVGHGYGGDQVIGHVLTAVHLDGEWVRADGSSQRQSWPLGECAPFTRERVYSIPNIKMLCDSRNCLDNKRFDPVQLGFVTQGTFVGVNGVPDDVPAPVCPACRHDVTLLERAARTLRGRIL